MLGEAAATLAAMAWAEDPWHALTTKLKETTGRKGRALFQPLRLAPTGQGAWTGHGCSLAADRPRARFGERLQAAA